jgi:thioredoxin reductase (NADPH)
MRPLKNICEVAVIGGGLAGLTAARQAARLGRLVTLFEPTGMYGGQVATVHEVEGLPVPGHFSGQDLAIAQLEEARKIGVHVVETGMAKIELGETLTLTDDDGRTYHPEAVIIASGASLRKLGVPGEEAFTGRGVSRCATCDGGFFRGEDVVVVGGGDSAAQEALTLAKTSRKVIMVCHAPMSAKRDYIDRLAARENVEFMWDSEVSAIIGENGVSGVTLRNVKSGAASDLACAGVFPYVGVEPNTGFVPGSLLAKSGHVKTNGGLSTADPRVFAVGAARAGYGGNLIEAMGEGASAAEAAARRLAQ